ncbi:hypothetical protein BSKO_09250 [Bryopsis sp. KO-2023]|nr:hypothetical protein BSKO_09250 [Bryopsis sp. KO-2023]
MSSGDAGVLGPARWQDGDHTNMRTNVTRAIFNLISRKRPNIARELNPKLSLYVKQLEDALFRSARTLEEYSDTSTLELRLQQVAIPQVRVRKMYANGFQGSHSTTPGFVAGPEENGAGGGVGRPPSSNYSGMSHGSTMLGQGNGTQRGMSSVGRHFPGVGMQDLGGGLLEQSPRQGFDLSVPNYAGTPPGGLSPRTNFSNGVQGGGITVQSKGSPLMSNGMPIVLNRTSRDWSFYMDAHNMGQIGPGVVPNMSPGGFPQNNMGDFMGRMVPANARGPVSPSPEPPAGGGSFSLLDPHRVVPNDGRNSMSHSGQGSAQSAPSLQNQQAMEGGFDSRVSPLQVPTSITVPPNRAHIPVTSLPAAGAPHTPPPPVGQPTNGNAVNTPNLGLRQGRQSLRELQHLLVFVRHCGKCNDGQRCHLGEKCAVFKKLLRHVMECKADNCPTQNCSTLKPVLVHHLRCQDSRCSFCGPIIEYAKREREREKEKEALRRRNHSAGGGANLQQNQGVVPPPRIKMEPMQGLVPQSPGMGGMAAMGMHGQNMGMVPAMSMMCPPRIKRQFESPMGPGMVPVSSRELVGGHLQGMVPVSQIQSQMVPVAEAKPAPKRRKQQAQNLPSKPSIVMLQQRLMGTSLLETFTPDEIREHVASTRGPNWVPLSAGQKEDICCICGQKDLHFEPPVINCESCFGQVKRGVFYWELPQKVIGTRCLFCHSCITRENKDTFLLGQKRIKKVELVKKKNDELETEAWVQCDRCGYWAHQVCAMFNKGQNADDMSYNCPDCLVEGINSGRRQLPAERPRAMWSAEKLPECKLSRALEERVRVKLAQERLLRAQKQGLRPEDVPTVEGITIRVLNVVDRSTVVQPNFLKAFKKKGFPGEFKHKQKVIFLFQKVDGVNVCLFAMYTQEYGDNCPSPNRKWVYLSYVDSVKYFRPEIPSVSGQALRTYVYHELLLGYFKYVKELGYCAMFIWACPPSQTGDDYILYCKPQRQKTPTPDRLRNWYIEMIQKGRKEGIVARLSNLSDTFFEGGRDRNSAPFSATDVPYFDGDYWPGEVEKLLSNVMEENGEDMDKKINQRGGKRKGRGRGATTDEALLNSILKGQPVPQWEDFMVVHLREPCSFCGHHIKDGRKYSYCKSKLSGIKQEARERRFEGIRLDGPGSQQSLDNLQLCSRCYGEAVAAGDSALPGNSRISDLKLDIIEKIPMVKDDDGDMACEILESRHNFLSLCKGNHYQFDTLRRAKHSTMMVLYHLHNPMAPAFASSCNSCQKEMEPGCGYRCSVCNDFDMCQDCKDAGVHHEHPLVAQGKEAVRQSNLDQVKKFQLWLTALSHAASCNGKSCTARACMRMKELFIHVRNCQSSSLGQACRHCTTYNVLLRKHSRQCTTENCPIHGCSDLKDKWRRSKRNEHGMRVRHYMMGYNRGPKMQQIQWDV